MKSVDLSIPIDVIIITHDGNEIVPIEDIETSHGRITVYIKGELYTG